MDYIRRIAERTLWNSGKVELWDFSRANTNLESRIEAVATVASICYGKLPCNARKLVERLWTESSGLPSSAFEFIRDGRIPGIEDSLRNNPQLATYEDDPESLIDELTKRHRENIATFRLKVPIFVARQVMRHRRFSYQELSRRYTDDKRVPLDFWLPEPEGAENDTAAVDLFQLSYAVEERIYQLLRGLNVRAEITRGMLGTGLYTEFWMMGDREAWANYFALRLDQHAQQEHRELARVMRGLLAERQPEFAFKAL
ncbi:hypothetical protein DRJ12_05050 [Candidatus Acetothermia bacterium]|nr:MAG: hypothetical protein DRJ12_05050 [Candidatus Acetothermia bacterium]